MSWDALKPLLLEESARRPCPLVAYPDPRVAGGRRAPFRIRLAAWAPDLAARLAADFGDEVVLVVGCLSYPDGRRVDASGRPWRDEPRREAVLLDPAELEADLGELELQSGHQVLTDLLVTNHTRTPVELRLPASRDVTIVDPEDGAVVGGPVPPAHPPPRRTLVLAPRATTPVPVTVGTAAYDRSTGWAVPPGAWALRAFLERPDGRALRAPLLPVTIT